MQMTFPSYHGFIAVTPSDTTLLNCRALWVGGAGALALSPDATTAAVTLSAVPAGTLVPVSLNGGRVMAASTATLIIALS